MNLSLELVKEWKNKLGNNIIKKGLSEEIIISKGTEDEIEQLCNKFFNVITAEVKSFEEELQVLEKYGTEHPINGDIFFKSEKLTKRSPLTIIDAPGGTGKTYFVEKLIEFFNKIEDKKDFFFKKIIFLDAGKYSISKNPKNDLINNIISAIIEINPHSKIKIIPNENGYGIGYDNLESWDFPKTIIFLDNVERLGQDAWLILKALGRMLEAKNFIFILPMNKNKMIELLSGNQGESSFEKYIDIKYFEFKQNYLYFLKNMKFNNKFSNILNELLEIEIKGEKISIREAEKRIRANNILMLSNQGKLYDTILSFAKNIGGSNDQVREYIRKDIKDFFLKWDGLRIIFNDVKNDIKMKFRELILFKKIIDSETDEDYGKSLMGFLNDEKFLDGKNIFHNGEKVWQQWGDYIELSTKNIEKYILIQDDNVKKLLKEKDKEINGISIQKKIIEKNKYKIDEEKKEHSPDHNQIQSLENAIKGFNEDIQKYSNRMEYIDKEISNIENNKILLNKNLELLESQKLFILKYISSYKNEKIKIMKETDEYKRIFQEVELLWSEEQGKNDNYAYNDGSINDDFINEIFSRIVDNE